METLDFVYYCVGTKLIVHTEYAGLVWYCVRGFVKCKSSVQVELIVDELIDHIIVSVGDVGPYVLCLNNVWEMYSFDDDMKNITGGGGGGELRISFNSLGITSISMCLLPMISVRFPDILSSVKVICISAANKKFAEDGITDLDFLVIPSLQKIVYSRHVTGFEPVMEGIVLVPCT